MAINILHCELEGTQVVQVLTLNTKALPDPSVFLPIHGKSLPDSRTQHKSNFSGSLQTWSPRLARTSCCVGVQGDMSFSSCQQRHAWILPQRAPKLFTNNYPGEQMFHSLYRFLDIFEFPIVPREVTPGL